MLRFKRLPWKLGLRSKARMMARTSKTPSETAGITPVVPHTHGDRHARYSALDKPLARASCNDFGSRSRLGRESVSGDVPPQAHHAEGMAVENQWAYSNRGQARQRDGMSLRMLE
jgi:hypothetical protein